jgi:hypothetical protein
MARRGISQSDVDEVLADYDVSYPSSTSNRHCYAKTIGNRRIVAIVEPYDHELVVTAFDQLEQS